MSTDDEPIRLSKDVRRRLREARRTKVRYGRATLTVDRAVSVLGTPIGEALAGYRRQELDADEVAWRFLREQAVSHSPTFDWETVTLAKLLPRVTAVMREPELSARTPEQLVAELEKVEATQVAARKRLSEQLQKYARPFNPDFLKIMRRSQPDLRLLNQQNRMLLQQSEVIQNAMRPLRIQEEFAKRQQSQLEQIGKALLPTLNLDAFGLSQERMRQILGLNLPNNLLLQGIKTPFLEQDWRPVFERVAEAARQAEVPEVAEAVTATAHEAEKDDSDVDLDAIREAIEDLTEQFEESNRLDAEKAEREKADSGSAGNNSFKNQLVIGTALMVIRWMLEAFFIRLDLPFPLDILDAPEPPDVEPPEPDSEPPDADPPDSLA